MAFLKGSTNWYCAWNMCTDLSNLPQPGVDWHHLEVKRYHSFYSYLVQFSFSEVIPVHEILTHPFDTYKRTPEMPGHAISGGSGQNSLDLKFSTFLQLGGWDIYDQEDKILRPLVNCKLSQNSHCYAYHYFFFFLTRLWKKFLLGWSCCKNFRIWRFSVSYHQGYKANWFQIPNNQTTITWISGFLQGGMHFR